ncbi:MAG TPA: type VI secretion system-associated FHA domain protein TagH [Candidatus Binataceae bacterium]|jgi:type VI secretion system protein|nr:type VI secretion system-associated FHA domain protein TagH [Candidatus Binataceae bacterium]
MALRLRVVSDHANLLGEQSTKVFGVHGGTLGRSTDNEWILPDPERYLSGKHARIDFRAGTYILVDTSSNGTYVNGAQVPLGKYHDYVLKEGDYIRLGEYELLVSIDKSNDFPPDDSAIVAYDGESASSAVKKSTANDLGEDLDLSQLLEQSDLLASDSGVRPRDAYGQAISGRAQPALQPSLEPEPDAAGTPWHMMTRPLKVEGPKADRPTPPPRAPNPVLYDGDFDVGLAAFCRGADIDPAAITTEARGAALTLAGQMLREAVLGLMDLNQSRNEFRNRFRISAPANDGPESPLNFSKGVDEALVRLLTTLSTRNGSVETIRTNFRELKAQNTATLTATRAAFEEFLGRVDPKELEERFDRATKRGVFGSQNKAKYWDLYGEMFAGLAQRPADGFPHSFTETFAKAYEAKLRALVPPRRSTFGADRAEPADPDDQAVGDR